VTARARERERERMRNGDQALLTVLGVQVCYHVLDGRCTQRSVGEGSGALCASLLLWEAGQNVHGQYRRG